MSPPPPSYSTTLTADPDDGSPTPTHAPRTYPPVVRRARCPQAVEERNYTGIQLIDRNDELCILYEKSNMQQSVLKKGEAEIRLREEEIRMLDLQVGAT